MKRCKTAFQNPLLFFAAGFVIGLFVKFLPFFIILMLLFLAAEGICRYRYR